MNEVPTQTMGEGDRRHGSRSAIFLSAFLYPGAGQFSQGRWVVGIFYVLTMTVFLVLLFREVLIPIYALMQWVLSLAEQSGRGTGDPPSVSFKLVGLWFAVSLFVWGASLFDVALAQRRLLRAQRESELLRKLEEKQP